MISSRCGLGDARRHFPTWGNCQLDHGFVSESLADQVRTLRLDTDAVAAGMSDHTPVIVDFALDRRPADPTDAGLKDSGSRKPSAS